MASRMISAGHARSVVSNSFPGAIDGVRIYNRALSAAEVQELYKLGTATILSK